MEVKLYIFSKKINSTAQPDSGTTVRTYNGQLKEGCSFISPVLSFNFGNIANLTNYNYAYITEFNRFYYIEDWTYEESQWIASMSVDSLASWKTEIGNKTLYILRAFSEYDTNIVDSLYPTKADTEGDIHIIGSVFDNEGAVISNYFLRNYNAGFFIVGVVGENLTGVTYYVLNAANFKTVLNKLMNYQPSDMSDVSSGIAKSLANPIQYLTSCYWLPYAIYTNPQAQDINFGRYKINVTAHQLANIDMCQKLSAYFLIGKHPQHLTRGEYLNLSPYTRHTLVFNPFGSFALDSLKIANTNTIRAEWVIDYSCGEADLRVFNDDTDELVINSSAKMGVPIQVSQITVDTIGTLGSALGGIGGAIAGVVTGNYIGAVTSVASGIVGAVEGQQPQLSSKGTSGSFISYSIQPRIYSSFTLLVDEDCDHAGRPLCKEKLIKQLSGYIQCRDGDIDIPATAQEISAISNYLTNGFFYE